MSSKRNVLKMVAVVLVSYGTQSVAQQAKEEEREHNDTYRSSCLQYHASLLRLCPGLRVYRAQDAFPILPHAYRTKITGRLS
jgi:hypothetical protein